MGSESNPILNDEIDVYAKDYSIDNDDDIEAVIQELDREFPDEIGDYLRRDVDEDGWRFHAVLASMLFPYLDYEWEHVDLALEIVDPNYPMLDRDDRQRVKHAVEYVPLDEDVDTPADVKIGENHLEMIESHEVPEVDPESKIREKVLKRWHPREYGIYPDEDGVDIDVIEKTEAIHLTAEVFDETWNYLYPESDVRGWQTELYVYDDELGIYRPRGENQIKTQVENLLGKYSDNHFINEIVSKVKRRNKVDSWDMEDARPEPNRIVVGNGILDLRTGELDAYNADEYHRTRIDVDYDPDAECPEIDEFFGDIVADDDVPTLYRVVAHTLAKEYIDEKAVMLVGDGNNGKSSFLNLLEEFLGERNIAGRSLQDLSEDRWAPADLHGSLANLSGDMSEQEADDLSTFKQLTGGDTLTGDVKFTDPVRFTNHASLIFASNGVPDLPDNDMAVWQRWCYINFPNRFGEDGNKEAEPMRVLMDRITAEEELQGLLARCVEEYQAYYDGRDFFADVGDAHEVRKRMKKAAEPVFRFAEEMLVKVDPADSDDPEEYMESTARVRQAYREYARNEGLPIIDEARFGERISNLRDYSISKGESRAVGESGRTYVYKGIQLTDEAEALLNDEDTENDETGNAQLDDEFEDEDEDDEENTVRVRERTRGAVREVAKLEAEMNPEEIADMLEVREEAMWHVEQLVEEARSSEDENEGEEDDGDSLAAELAADGGDRQ